MKNKFLQNNTIFIVVILFAAIISLSIFFKYTFSELFFSILIRLVASIIATILFYQHKDKRILVFTLLFLLMAFRQTLTLLLWMNVIEKSNTTRILSEFPGYCVTILSLISIIYLGRILKGHDEIISKQNENLYELHGLLPICSKCKKIRDTDGYWQKLEQYFDEHSHLQFSHGLCDDCANELYGDEPWFNKIKSDDK